MRLWHTDLIPVLPRQQLLGQWRELNCIFSKMPNHILIDFVYGEDEKHLYSYSCLVINEMKRRGYCVVSDRMNTYFSSGCPYISNPFPNKMTDRYLRQCYYNLQEKYDCGGITEGEWTKIEEVCKDVI